MLWIVPAPQAHVQATQDSNMHVKGMAPRRNGRRARRHFTDHTGHAYRTERVHPTQKCTQVRTHKQSTNAQKCEGEHTNKVRTPKRVSVAVQPTRCLRNATTETHANTNATNAVHTQTGRSLLHRSPRIFERPPCGPFLMKGSVFSQFGF